MNKQASTNGQTEPAESVVGVRKPPGLSSLVEPDSLMAFVKLAALVEIIGVGRARQYLELIEKLEQI